MFRTLLHRWRRPRMKDNVRRTVESLYWEFVTFDIVPPREQKLLKYSQKRVKWGAWDIWLGIAPSAAPVCVFWKQQLHDRNRPVSRLLYAEGEIGRRTATTILD